MNTNEWQQLVHDASGMTVSDPLASHPNSGSSDDGRSVQGSASPTPSSSSSSSTPKKKKRGGRATPRNTNISRERRKQELEYLRTLVCDLKTELTSLQERRDDMLRPHLEGDTGAYLTIAPVWEGIAKRQFQGRKKAEGERERLRTLLLAQTQVAEDLINVIQRARKIQQDVVGLQEIPQLANQTVTVQEQLMRLRILCGQWYVAFSWYAQLQTGPMRSFESRVVSDDGVETVIDIYSTQAFPFATAQVEHALWATLQAGCTEDEFVFAQDCEASEDTLVTKFTATSYRDGTHATVKGTHVTRRYRDDQGHFLIASNVIAAPEIPDALYPEKDFVLAEDTWVRIINAKELSGVVAAPEANSTLTVLQHVRRSRIRFANADNHVGDHRLRALMKLHLSLIEEILRWGQQNIESFLMRNSMSEMSICQ